MKLNSKLARLRRWVDRLNDVEAVEFDSQRGAPTQTAEAFVMAVVREAIRVLDYEAFTPPGGVTYIPGEFIVFLSSEDDREWHGTKRRGLQHGLAFGLERRASELCGQNQLSNSSFVIDLQVDGTLERGQFDVKAIWETNAKKTRVSARRSSVEHPIERHRFDEELTVIKTRPRLILYSIEVWRDSAREATFPVTKPEIVIGRGSRATQVDLQISGDPAVSRFHALMTREASGICWLTPKGENPLFLNGREQLRDERVRVKAGDNITISSFVLRVHGTDP